MAMALTGAGFGRTEALLLREVLERLGFGLCYQMDETIEKRGRPGFPSDGNGSR
jgi:hypothetical protein